MGVICHIIHDFAQELDGQLKILGYSQISSVGFFILCSTISTTFQIASRTGPCIW